MRSARTVVRQATGSWSGLAVVSLLGVLGCEEPVALTPGYGTSGTTSNGGAFVLGQGASAGTVVSAAGALPSGCMAHPVSSAEGGAASLDDEICSATMEPVLADGAAQIHLVLTNADPRQPTTGIVTFPEGVRGHVNGAPSISVDRTIANLDGVVSSLSEIDEGYSFAVTFGPDSLLVANDQTRVSLRAAFDYRCEGGSRLVSAVTELRLCGGFPTPITWAGPGDSCVVCYESQPRP